MSDGSQFADFANFVDEGYARGHGKIIAYKRNGDTLNLEVCAVDIVNTDCEQVLIDQAPSISETMQNADVVLKQPSEAAQSFAFATCSYQTWNSRTIVYAVRLW